MRKQYSILVNSSIAAFMTLLLTACGGGGDGSNSTGTASLSLTDAPVDDATGVVISVGGVEFQPSNGDRLMFSLAAKDDGTCEVVDPPDPSYPPCQVNLMDYTGTERFTLLDNVTLPAGGYPWIRLDLNDPPGYIMLADGQHNLQVPSEATTGLKLVGKFTVAAGNYSDYTIDFDLRKSVHDPANGSSDYILRPTLRMVDNLEVGTLSGNVDPIFFESGNCTGVVYVFDANTPNAPDDEDGVDDPITTAMVPDDGVYGYTVGFLAEGDYLVAFTCDAAADAPGVEDAGVTFLSQTSTLTPVHITAGQNTVQNFPP